MSKNKFNNKFSNLESSENTKKYVKEMYDLAEKHEKRSFMSFVAIGIPIAVILLFVVIQMISFSIHSSKNKQVVSKSHTTNTTDVKKDLAKGNTKSDAKVAKTAPDAVNQLNDRLFNYLKLSEKRAVSYYRAKQLNNKSEKGLASIYIAQVLRDNGYKMDNSIINTASLVRALQKDGWKIISDYKQLKKGDICFTTSANSSGPPAHTYAFMGWVQEGKTDYAYVSDSQVAEYGNTYHKRNINFTTPKKEKFAFFMRK